MPVASDWQCCRCRNTWSSALYAACMSCHHRNCSRCTPLHTAISEPKPKRRHPPYKAATRSRPDPSCRANIMHGGPRSIERDTLPEGLGTSNDDSLGTSNIAGRTPNRDNQCANFASSPSGEQVRLVASPTRKIPGALDAALLHSHESEQVIQNPSSCASESLSGVKSDSSVIANTATSVDNDLVSRLELLQANPRYFASSFSSFFDS
jgi:hypothetical protein